MKNIHKINNNIYITSDEEAKEGDWGYIQFEGGNIKLVGKYFADDWKKIILTTDQDLIKDGVQAIDDEFLEWFVKNPSCEEVEYVGDDCYYEIIIPQEEPKQETLEEAAENYNDKFQENGGSKPPHIKNTHIMNHFIAGAKWQQDMADNWLTMKEGDITVNFKPMPKFDEPISLLNNIRANPSWETIIREFHIATQQVEIGTPPLIFECWLVDNYNPPTKKQN